MAEIKILRSLLNVIKPRYIIYVLLPLLVSLTLIPREIHIQTQTQKQTQVRKRIDLKHADDDFIERDKESRKDWHRLIGNVWLIHNEISMKCDSAHWFPDKDQVIAFSRIHIEQGDTLDITGNYLFYDGTTEQALMNENVELIDKKTHLFTNSIKYDVRNEIAQYTDSGRIINGKNTLTSHIGIYYVSNSLFHFKDSVKIVNPDYVMKGDTMDYNTKTETAFFTGPSEMKGDSIYLYCEKGWYDTKNDITRIWENAVIDNNSQRIFGDSIYYDSNSGYGQSWGSISIIDTTNSIIVKGNYAWYYKKPEKFMVTDSAMFIQVLSDKDSLFLHSDTISAVTLPDSAGKEYRLMRAFHGCKIFSKDLQAKCDSLSYSFQDSIIRLYRLPVLWSAENQLTSDTMAIYTKNRKTDRMELYYSAFVASQVDSLRFNQIKGRTLTGYFENNELYKININGNGESIYYLVDGDDIIGKNSAKCASIEIMVNKGKIQQIWERQSPEGVIDPPSKSPNANNHLEGFNWLDSIRPRKVADIFK
jgi:lipopolysaccharide export system protein LptA